VIYISDILPKVKINQCVTRPQLIKMNFKPYFPLITAAKADHPDS